MHKLKALKRTITRIVECVCVCVFTKYARVSVCVHVCCNYVQFRSDFVFRLRIYVVVAMRINRYSIIPPHTRTRTRSSATHKNTADTLLIFRNAAHILMHTRASTRAHAHTHTYRCRLYH